MRVGGPPPRTDRCAQRRGGAGTEAGARTAAAIQVGSNDGASHDPLSLRPTPAARGRWRSEKGSAPAAALAWVGVTAVLVGALALLGQGVVAHARAATAADLSALAAADALAVGTGSPCALAAQVAVANGAHLVGCTIIDQDVLVAVDAPAGPLPPPRAEARAGPGPVATGPDSVGEAPHTP